MEGEPSFKFSKPGNPDHQTRFLFAGNCGPGVGMTQQQVQALFAPFCPAAQVVIPNPTSSYVFIVFETVDQAASAMEALKGMPLQELGRALVLRYTDAKVQQAAAPVSRASVARTAEELGIDGLQLIHNFITPEEEQQLLEQVAQGDWCRLAKRRVQHYGWEFNYAARSFSQQLGPLPAWAQSVADRVAAVPGVDQQVDQLTVNEYTPGIGLAPHIDTHSAFTGAIVSLSLGSDAVMELRKDSEQRGILLPRRSLLVLGGESRYAWQHYIPHRKIDELGPGNWEAADTPPTDGSTGDDACTSTSTLATSHQYQGNRLIRGIRTSFTFRKIRGFPCECNWPEHCDSRTGGPLPTRIAALGINGAGSSGATTATALSNQQQPAVGVSQGPQQSSGTAAEGLQGVGSSAQLEASHVHAVYDAIAPHFSATRFAIWPKVREFIDWLPAGALVADVGCGNGKYFGVRSDIMVLGSDRSAGLAELAAKRLQPLSPGLPLNLHADVLQADGLELPYRSDAVDGVLCIAVLHHMSSAGRRLAMMAELLRILRPGGRAVVTVWALEQEEPRKTIDKWSIMPKPAQRPGIAEHAELDALGADYMVPWHVPFHRVELAAAAAAAARGAAGDGPGQEQVASGGDKGNAPVATGRLAHDKGAVVYNRYYHLFEKGELEALVGALPGSKLVDSFFDKSNWCVVYEKL